MAMLQSKYSSLSSLLLLLLFYSPTMTTCADETPTHLHLFFHEIIAGPNKTSFIVAGRNTSAYAFGDLVVFDSALRETPDPGSKLVGRAQGMSVMASMADNAVLTPVNYVFTDGEYSGSTLAILGRVADDGTAERTVVGGSGKFRMARGYVVSKLVNESATAYIVELDFYVFKYY